MTGAGTEEIKERSLARAVPPWHGLHAPIQCGADVCLSQWAGHTGSATCWFSSLRRLPAVKRTSAIRQVGCVACGWTGGQDSQSWLPLLRGERHLGKPLQGPQKPGGTWRHNNSACLPLPTLHMPSTPKSSPNSGEGGVLPEPTCSPKSVSRSLACSGGRRGCGMCCTGGWDDFCPGSLRAWGRAVTGAK